MNDDQLLRYSRHLFLPEIDVQGQETLLASRVVIVGAGGLGSAAAYYLAASGVGSIAISDRDEVDVSNLQRQILYTTHDIGKNKAHIACQRLLALNPDLAIHPISGLPLTEEIPHDFMQAFFKADVIIDASDNFATRYKVNALCVQAQKPLVSGSAIGFEGQVAVFPLSQKTSPCYACLYPEQEKDAHQAQCRDTGVLGPIVGVIGSLQATEALKILLHIQNPTHSLLRYHAKTNQWQASPFTKDPTCKTCSIYSS